MDPKDAPAEIHEEEIVEGSSASASGTAASAATGAGETVSVQIVEEPDSDSDQAAAGGTGLTPEQQRLVDEILEFGYPEELAIRALTRVNFASVGDAVNWILDQSESSNSISHSSVSDEDDDDMLLASHKMVFVVNGELKMGVGKVASQVGHAAIGLYRKLERNPTNLHGVARWYLQGQRKIVLKGNSAEHLLTLKNRAEESGLPTLAVYDAGCTQVDPGSLTVVTIFGQDDKVDAITRDLKLL